MMTTLLALLAQFWRPIAAFLVGLGAYAKGRADAKAKADRKELQANIETRKRIDEADVVGDVPDAARRWLRKRGKPGGDL